MTLIADSGSTKTSWCIIDNNTFDTCITIGINPFYINEEEIIKILEKEFNLQKYHISSINFYGAGCALPQKKQVLENTLKRFFGINNIHIESDLLGAARSLCQNNAGIACILGTGSNSCYYNGKNIIQNISPLGYILGDEGSGAVLGKKLLSGILKNQLPKDIQKDFFQTYQTDLSSILENVYRKPFPNRYLSQYAHFISKHIRCNEINNLVESEFHLFFKKNIMQYKEANYLPLHFTGSIAYIFSSQLKNIAHKNGFKIDTITQTPMEGLVQYHQNNLSQ